MALMTDKGKTFKEIYETLAYVYSFGTNKTLEEIYFKNLRYYNKFDLRYLISDGFIEVYDVVQNTHNGKSYPDGIKVRYIGLTDMGWKTAKIFQRVIKNSIA